MVDYVYYGRGDKANIRLSDDQVRSILADRARAQKNILDDLRQMAEDDPLPEDDRKNGHIYVLAQPEAAPNEVLVDFLGRADLGQVVNQVLQQIRVARGGSSFQPELAQLGFPITRAEGKALTTTPGGAEIYDDGMIDLLLREDGGIRLICGRGTGFHTHRRSPGPTQSRWYFRTW